MGIASDFSFIFPRGFRKISLNFVPLWQTMEKLSSQLMFDIPFLEMRHPQLAEQADNVTKPVRRAEAHAEQLKHTADTLQTLLNGTRQGAENPLRAVNAYRDMAAAVDEAQAAVDQAVTVVDEANQQVEISPAVVVATLFFTGILVWYEDKIRMGFSDHVRHFEGCSVLFEPNSGKS